MRTGVGAARTIAAWGLAALAIAGCRDAAAPASSQARSPLAAGPDAAVPEPPPLLQSPPANQQATWQNLWGSWPADRYDFAMSYDSDKSLIIVQGGRQNANNGPYYGDTWVWDGARGAWVEKTPATGNNYERVGHSMVYDPIRKKTFLFSGWQPGAGFFISDMWEFDSTTSTWSERTAQGTQPSARYGYGMVWDPDRQKVILFGGFDETGVRKNDLWAWDGTATTWTPVPQTGMIPTPRYGHKMAYDVARKKIVLHSGNIATNGGTFVNDVYELDATGAWTKPTPPSGGSGNYYYGYDTLAYDVGRSRVVMYAGSYTPLFDWDPVTPAWTMLTATKMDPAGPGAAFVGWVYDSSRSMSVLFGGTGSRLLWEWNGADFSWTNRSTPVSGPLQRLNPALAYDSTRSKLMVFGGRTNGDNIYRQDIWEWSHTDATFISRTTAATKPSGRFQTAMAYDSKGDRLLLYGGNNGTTVLDDFWAWHPADRTWEPLPITQTPRPPATTGHQMFYDATNSKLLMVGGNPYVPIWQWDPATGLWTERSTPQPQMPAGVVQRNYAAMAYDSDRGKVVVYGGFYLGGDSSDIWEWDVASGVWSQRDVPASGSVPGGRKYPGIAYDSGRRVMVMYGGQGGVTGVNGATPLSDSWEWDGKLNVWTETTAAGVKPLPRYQHLMMYDPTRATTYVFGGNVPADTTYGLQEIWEYFPNSTPRPNGAACSAATASSCASTFCVDGVCCAAASCTGMCQACNVPGSAGTCANVLPGTPDDSCKSDDLACDANQQCRSSNGQACGSYADCASGHCADNVCCDTDCTDTCKACNLGVKRGTCSNLASGLEDPNGAPACASDAGQGRSCDGNGVCTNLPKPPGAPCTAAGQCASGYCIDGVCCTSDCRQNCYSCNAGTPGTCTVLAAGLQDHSATVTCDGAMKYCSGNGSCLQDKKPNGSACTAAADCGSNFCVDGYCCNSSCTSTCQSCAVAGKLGSCVNLPAGSPDDNATPKCSLPTYCDAAGTCQSTAKANSFKCTTGAECASGFCADGYCCDSACDDTCRACNLPQLQGTCSLIAPGGNDLNAKQTCLAPNYCASGGDCPSGKKPDGTACVQNNECGSNYCIDGVCCDSACFGKCMTCKNATGTCTPVAAGTDPRGSCPGAYECAGTCDGAGSCIFPAAGTVCGVAGCASTGVIQKQGTCNGAGACSGGLLDDCKGFTCFTDPTDGTAKCRTSCDGDPTCQIAFYCDDTSKCPADFPNAHTCVRDAQCQSNHCAISPGATSGVCCDRDCRTCGTCNLPGKEGTCVPVPAGQDPENDCIDSASDPGGKCGGKCNGQWGCEFPKAGTVCGQCKACDGASKCNVVPDDDATCGDIACDMLDNTCNDYHPLKVKRCASLGACKKPTPANCTDVTVLCQPDAGGTDSGSSPDATTPPDATSTPDASKDATTPVDGPKDATTPPDATTPVDTGGTKDATGGTDATGPNGGGGGGCCSVGATGPRGAVPAILALGLAFVLAGRRRRRG